MQNDISIVTEISVERVILQLGGVQVSTCVLVNAIFANHSLEIIKSKEVRVVSARDNKGSRCASIGKLIVTLEH